MNGILSVSYTHLEVYKRHIKASIVLANGEEGTDKLRSEIMKSLKKNIASYKWPKILDFTKELPKTISGKIRRKEIKENDWNENEDNE